MNVLDLIIALILAWFMYLGFKKGLIASVASLIGLFIGLYYAIRFSDWVGRYLFRESEMDEGTIALASFIITFIGVLVLTYFISKIVMRFVRVLRLGWLDKLSGALFGSAKAILILSVMLGFFNNINHNYWIVSESTMNQSKLSNTILDVSDNIFPRITDFYYSFLDEYMPGTSSDNLEVR